MGATESKPSFPTQQQWDQYRTEKVDKMNEIQESILIEKKEVEKLQKDLSKDIVDYMRECQDRSIFKRFISDNSACTKAKAKLLDDTMNIAVKLGSVYETERKIYSKKF